MIMLPKLLWKASPNFSERTAAVDLIVAHDCQGGYAGSIATFMDPNNNGRPVSAHIVLKEDGSEATQMVSFDKKAWHVATFNSRSIGLEMAGFAEKGFATGEWAAEASMIATLLHLYKIPCQWSKDGKKPGFCRHYDLGKAGGGHSDPTTDNAVWNKFVTQVKAIYDAGGFPNSWGRGSPNVAASKSTVSPQGSVVNYKIVQADLNTVGLSEPLDVDGKYGELTEAALIMFQKANDLPPTGIADTATLIALAKATA